MNKNLIIVGAGVYGVVASEIAMEMGCFEKIDFVDDTRASTPNGIEVIGTIKKLDEIACNYSNIIVAIGDPEVRLRLLKQIEEETPYCIVTLVSPRAYISSSAQVMPGCVIEPMAVLHTGCVVAKGCFVSAGAVVNHCTMLCDGVHVDCNATVVGNTLVPAGTKICAGEVFKRDSIAVGDLFFDAEKWAEHLNEIKQPHTHTPMPIDGKVYSFDDVM